MRIDDVKKDSKRKHKGGNRCTEVRKIFGKREK